MTKNVLIRAGYQAMWISNLGLASNNASASLLMPTEKHGMHRQTLSPPSEFRREHNLVKDPGMSPSKKPGFEPGFFFGWWR